MTINWSQPGLILSGGLHATLVALALVAFTGADTFEEVAESIPVEVITPNQFSEMTRGEREATKPVPAPRPRADIMADLQETKPPSPLELKREISVPAGLPPETRPDSTTLVPAPAPPERPRELDDQAAKAKAAQEKAAAEKAAEIQAQAKAKAEAKAAEEAEALEQARAEKAKVEKAAAEAKAKAEAEAKARAEAEARRKKEAEARAESQRLAALAAAEPPRPVPAKEKPFDPSAIEKLLQTKEKPTAAPSTAQEINRTAALGTATGNSQRLSPSQREGLGQILKDQIIQCWNPPPGLARAESLRPRVRIRLNPDGTLASEPLLMNSSPDSGFPAMSDSALRAVRRCAPFKIPPEFAPYFGEWRDLNINFDLKDMLG